MRPIKTLILCVVFAVPALAADEQIPWPEHPRPDFVREPWLNLNGKWKFAFDPDGVGQKEGWYQPGARTFDREIIVPFPWESRLSGIGDTQYQGSAWYAREVTIPDGSEWEGKDPWLIIGACDFKTAVFVNGRLAGSHKGGYLPFQVDLSPFARPGEKVQIAVAVEDRTDPQQPTGKQIHWYTRTSGIWQTVYLEGRARSHIYDLRISPNIGSGTADFTIQVSSGGSQAKYKLRIHSPQNAFAPVVKPVTWMEALRGRSELTITLREPRLWSPDSPTLYDAVIELLDGDQAVDRVQTYFGLREIAVQKAPGRDYQYIYLNGKPIYLRGALHQSFHPDGIYQYPDDATMRSDYELCKKIGINMLRIHIKTPIPRELYWADKLGVLIMQDLPNFWHHSKQARDWYEQMLEGAIARDFNHPALFAWVNFNETWGLDSPGPYDAERQKWVTQIYEKTKKLDPTRLVEDNSPCKYDHTVTDINSWHFYINDYAEARKHIAEVVEKTYPGSTFNYAKGYTQRNEPLMNSEYGGISAGLGDQDISWCFKYLTSELRKHDKICGYIYTELSDIEWEHNGFVNYDRSGKAFGYDFWHPGMTLRDLNSPDFVVIDAPPMIELQPGETREVPIRISHWSDHEAKDLQLRWCVRSPVPPSVEEAQQPQAPEPEWQSRPARWEAFRVVDQPPIRIAAQDVRASVAALLVELVDGETVLARNYVNLTTHRPDEPVGIRAGGPQRLIMHFSPGEFAERTFHRTRPVVGRGETNWVAGEASGHYQYDLQLPENLPLDGLSSIKVVAEVASCAGEAKLDWPARRTPHDRPQTDGKRWPSDLHISINGIEIERITLADDPADARGALSHHRGLQGGYGYLIAPVLEDKDKLRRLVSEAGSERLLRLRFEVPADAEHRGGLTLYGMGVGLNGLPPTVVLTFRGQGHGLPSDFAQKASPAVNRAVEKLLVPVATAESGGHEWRFRLEPPGQGWTASDFDDSQWRQGRGSFGSRGTPGAIVGVRWNRPEIWLRTRFQLDDAKTITGGVWRVHHDEDVEIYLNGRRVLARSGYVTDYIDIELDAAALAALRSGENVLAVHCRQTVGGQNIDVGLTLIRSDAR